MTSTGLTASAISAADVYSFNYHGYLLTHLDALAICFTETGCITTSLRTRSRTRERESSLSQT